ncbi:MAG: hypothetical protein M3151_13430, partial [Actinomycetota bacterium]|nr:hypothetical protein [Actinomycetota bacterium]
RILGNSIFSNAGLDGFGGLGINLVSGDDSSTLGANANDPGDADTLGGNGLQNKPTITSAVNSSGVTTVKGRLNSTADTSFKIQFFSNPSGNEGKRFIGEQNVSTNQDGFARLTFTPSQAIDAGQKMTATATGPEGTSEFSAPRTVVAQ